DWKKKDDSVSIIAHNMLAELYIKRNRPERAMDFLAAAAATRPELRMQLAILLYERRSEPGKRDLALTNARIAKEAFFKRLEENVDNHSARINYIYCCQMLGEFGPAKDQAQTGLILVARNPEIQQ